MVSNSRVLLGRLVATSEDRSVSLALLLVRVYFGLTIALAHALPKLGEMLAGEGHFPELVREMGFPAPTLFAWLATLAQLGGTLLIVLGLGTRIGALFVVSTLAVGLIGVHWGDPFAVLEAGLAYVVVLIALLLAGGGRHSIDGRLARILAPQDAR